MKGSTLKFLLGLLLLVCSGSCLLQAQSATNGAIGGTIYDTDGGTVPGAEITATNAASGLNLTAKTTATGIYRILEVPPGTYTVTVTASGFSTFKSTGVTVTVGSLADVSPKLTVGQATDIVEVTDTTPDLQTESSAISTTIDQNQIENLPINGRRWSNFALLTPGVVSNSDGFGLLSFRGISYLLNNSTVDGMDDNQAYFSEQRGRTRAAYAVSQAAVQEFQVNTSNFSAEYGRSAGGVINTVTKSGSNNLHGQLFFYDRDNNWGAKNPYTTVQNLNPTTGNYDTSVVKPKDWRKQWGFGIGGPLMRDKLFWFYSYDQQQRNFPGIARASDPADTFATAAATLPTGYTCSGGKITIAGGASLPSSEVGTSYACSTAYELGLGYQAGAAYYQQGLDIMNSFLGTVPRTGDQVINFPRLDWQVSDSDRITVQYNRLRWDSPAGLQTQASNFYGRASFGNDFVKEDFGIGRWVHTVNSSMVNEFRFQFGRDFEYETSQAPLPNEVPLSNNVFGRAPQTNIGYSFDSQGFNIGKPITLERAALPKERRIQGEDIYTWSHGKHVTKAGLDFNRVTDYISNLYAENGSYSFDYNYDFIADYMHAVLGVGASNYTSHYYSYAQGVGKPAGEIATSDYNGFLTDDWRITPRLTLTLGIRYEYEYIPGNPYQNPNLTLGFSNSLYPFINPTDVLTSYKPDDRNNIGPRLGFAYDLYGTGKTFLRGGYGMYYGRVINSNIMQSYLNNGSPSNGQVYYSSIRPTTTGTTSTGAACSKVVYPQLLSTDCAAALGASATISFLDPHLQNPQVHMVDLALEQSLGSKTSLSIMYMGSFARELTAATDVNAKYNATTPVTFTVTNTTQTLASGYVTYPHGGQPNPLREGQQIPIQVYSDSTRANSNYYQMLMVRSNINSSYSALALQFRHTMSKSFSIMANYTWAHSLDYNPYIGTGYGSFAQYDPNNLKLEYGNGSLDVRNRFVFAGNYAPRYHGGNYTTRALLDGWRGSLIVQAQSGLPFTPTVTGYPTQAGLTTINGSGGTNRLPQLGRNQFRYPGTNTADIRISKSFYFDGLNKHWRLELLGELFNLVNHQNITRVSTLGYTVCSSNKSSQAACNAITDSSSYTAYPYLVFSPNFGVYQNSNSNYVYSPRQTEIGARLFF